MGTTLFLLQTTTKLKLKTGLDEAGRGPLAGPVVVSAVTLNPQKKIHGLKDSKKLSPLQRRQLYSEIINKAYAVDIFLHDAAYIDQHNILKATLDAMKALILRHPFPQNHFLIDGNKIPLLETFKISSLIKGDQKEACISAASIVAKVTRDHLLNFYHDLYPIYFFKQNKGYPTKKHILALKKHGPCPIHRRSFNHVLS